MTVLSLLARWKQPLAVATGLAIAALSVPARAEKTAADYYVHSLPGAPEGPLLKMHAGYVPPLPGSIHCWICC
jgi:carboxypeptidase D